jgi:hypothetical protein
MMKPQPGCPSTMAEAAVGLPVGGRGAEVTVENAEASLG